ncbi:MAG: toxin [Planctomycetota bacterium]|nr:toxin [Planctomycetota bacterium]
MGTLRWDEGKNEWLLRVRGVCFEQVAVLLERGEVLDVVEHPNWMKHRGQKIIVVAIADYAYLVPYEHLGDDIVLKTIIPSRKATSKYLRGDHEEEANA